MSNVFEGKSRESAEPTVKCRFGCVEGGKVVWAAVIMPGLLSRPVMCPRGARSEVIVPGPQPTFVLERGQLNTMEFD